MSPIFEEEPIVIQFAARILESTDGDAVAINSRPRLQICLVCKFGDSSQMRY